MVCRLGWFVLLELLSVLPNFDATYSGMHFLHLGPSINRIIGSGKCFWHKFFEAVWPNIFKGPAIIKG